MQKNEQLTCWKRHYLSPLSSRLSSCSYIRPASFSHSHVIHRYPPLLPTYLCLPPYRLFIITPPPSLPLTRLPSLEQYTRALAYSLTRLLTLSLSLTHVHSLTHHLFNRPITHSQHSCQLVEMIPANKWRRASKANDVLAVSAMEAVSVDCLAVQPERIS